MRDHRCWFVYRAKVPQIMTSIRLGRAHARVPCIFFEADRMSACSPVCIQFQSDWNLSMFFFRT